MTCVSKNQKNRIKGIPEQLGTSDANWQSRNDRIFYKFCQKAKYEKNLNVRKRKESLENAKRENILTNSFKLDKMILRFEIPFLCTIQVEQSNAYVFRASNWIRKIWILQRNDVIRHAKNFNFCEI